MLRPDRPRRRLARALAAVAALTTLAIAGCAGQDPASAPEPDELTVVVLPHPDDEFQVWSQVEQQQDATTVFVLMTRGEQSGFCDSERGGGRWTPQCSTARIDSWLSFFTRMGESDPTIPSDLGAATTVDLDPGAADPARDDDGTVVPTPTADVWHDADGRGSLVAFDLGDGDLTVDEATWALQSVLDDREAFGLPDLPVGRVIGAYAYEGETAGCYPYPHPDHVAVAETVATVDLGARAQLSSTCSLDPDVDTTFTTTVSEASSEAAFGADGAFPASYDWLGPWPLAQDQSELFHREQSFVVR